MKSLELKVKKIKKAKFKIKTHEYGPMAELVDARDLKSLVRNSMWVRIPLGLPNKKLDSHSNFITILIK